MTFPVDPRAPSPSPALVLPAPALVSGPEIAAVDEIKRLRALLGEAYDELDACAASLGIVTRDGTSTGDQESDEMVELLARLERECGSYMERRAARAPALTQGLALIGRDRVVADELVKALVNKTFHPSRGPYETARGAYYEVETRIGVGRERDEPTGHRFRVEITLIPREATSDG